jgi:pimeloyl-ACP methyl ester carboxylesterase
MAAAELRRVPLWQDTVETEIEIAGTGAPLVWLHGPWGLAPDRDFVTRLAQTHTVYAPKHPGTSRGNTDAVHRLDTWLDLVVYYGELFDRLGMKSPVLAGHSFGALVAAEIAAAAPTTVSKLVMIDPVGLWRDEAPVKNWMLLPETERRKTLFAAPDGEGAKRFFAVPADAAERVDALAGLVWAQACTGKFVWPIPDRGLKKHIHRIAAPTLIVWGAADAIVPPVYAKDFAAAIKGAKVETIAGAGHLPHIEKAEETARVVQEFLR